MQAGGWKKVRSIDECILMFFGVTLPPMGNGMGDEGVVRMIRTLQYSKAKKD